MKDSTKRKIKISIYSFLSLIFLIGIFIWLSFHSLKLLYAEKMVSGQKYSQEEANQVYPKFSYLPPEWTNMFKLPMNNIWKQLDIKGMNYFVFGKPKSIFSSYSARSDPFSKYYQAWFGTYIIKGCVKWISKDMTRIDSVGLAQIAEKDQIAWLKGMGDKNPYAELRSVDSVDTVKACGKERRLYEETLMSHSDISTNTNKLIDLLGMPKLSYYDKLVNEYHDITLKCFICPWYNPQNDVTIIIYTCASKFKTKNNKVVDYFNKLKPEFIKMIKGVLIKTENKS